MESQILKTVYDYSTQKKIADPKFIETIINIAIKHKGLEDYVQKVQFTKKLRKDEIGIAAAYFPSGKKISIYLKALKRAIKEQSCYNTLFQGLELAMFQNLLVTQTILHELEHARQYKLANTVPDDSIETKLAKEELIMQVAAEDPNFLSKLIEDGELHNFVVSFSEGLKLYPQYYKFNPMERLAQINSFKTIVSTIEPIKDYLPNLYEFAHATLTYEMIGGYLDSWRKKGLCPTQLYLSSTGKKELWSKINFAGSDLKVDDSNSLEERLTLGLPVSYDEYMKTVDSLRDTNRFKK